MVKANRENFNINALAKIIKDDLIDSVTKVVEIAEGMGLPIDLSALEGVAMSDTIDGAEFAAPSEAGKEYPSSHMPSASPSGKHIS